jgi:hypothetical protein
MTIAQRGGSLTAFYNPKGPPMRALSAGCLALMLSACMASGVRVTPEQAAKFERGKTTYTEVITALGPPTTQMLGADGARTVIYGYSEAHPRPASFIPIIGPLVGGADSRTNVVMLRFDAGGVLQDWQASESNYGTGTGLNAGTPTTNSGSQPTVTP